MKIKDRIKGLRRVKASELQPHPKNWRTHPDAQKDALKGVYAEIGFAGALLVRELPDKTLQIIDGHLRAETTPDQKVPVLVVDLNDEEVLKLLALYDPIGDMAEADATILLDLVKEIETENAAVADVLSGLVAKHDAGKSKGGESDSDAKDVEIAEDKTPDPVPKLFQIVVECDDEEHQRLLAKRFEQEGLKLRILKLWGTDALQWGIGNTLPE